MTSGVNTASGRRSAVTHSRRRSYNIREVAEAAGTSVATVSRALKQPNVVAPATLKRVLAVINRLGYTPNAQAIMLRTARTHVIVAMVPDFSNPFFAEVIRGIEQVAHEHGYSVLLGDTQHSKAREATYAQLISTRQADGIITLLPHLPTMAASGYFPLVNACEYVLNSGVTSVLIDNAKAAQEATAYLLTLGHRRIAFLSGPMSTQICVDRDAGHELALREAGLTRNSQLTVQGDFSIESGVRAVELLLDRKRRFTAIFCSNDEMAMGAMQAIKARGLRIPEDISVVGFDDIRYARYTDPPLTTVAQPKEALGREAMALLFEILQGGGGPARKRVLPTQLIVRASTAAAKSSSP